jgi:hypothetical protein
MNLSEFIVSLPIPPRETRQQQRERYRLEKLSRRIDAEERRWFSEEIKPRMDAGMSFDEAYVAAGGTIVPEVPRSR